MRKILVPLTGGDRDTGALTTAMVVAVDLKAHVEGLFVRPDPAESLPFMGEGVAGPVIQDILMASKEAADNAANRAKASLTAIAGEAGVPIIDAPRGPGAPSASFAEDIGPFATIVGNKSLLSDLIVFENRQEDEGYGIGDALQECLMSRGRPILLSPPSVPAHLGRNATIGWDGSAEAAHAVRAAMPFLVNAERIQILNITSGSKDSSLTDTLADYLTYRGLESIEHVVDPQGRPIGEVLIDESVRAHSDLLIIGGYGHSRIRELLMGGATRHVISHATLPVLMAH